MPSERSAVKAALIGCGRFGRILGEASRSLGTVEITCTFDDDPGRAEELAAVLGASAAAGFDDVIADDGIDAVVIATTHGSHRDLAVAAMRAGKHVFCEKPMAVSPGQCQDMIEAAETSGKVLLIGHLYRLMPLVEAAKAAVEAGDIGTPLAVWTARSHAMRRLGWWARKDSYGGLLHSPGIHNLDLMNYFLGQPETVYAQSPPRVQAQVDYADTAFVTVSYAQGRVGSLFASISDPLDPPKGVDSFRLLGDRGALSIDFTPPGRLSLVTSGGHRVIDGDTRDQRQAGADQAVRAELENFVDAIAGAAPFITSQDAAIAVDLCAAAYLSADTGRPVRVAEVANRVREEVRPA